MKVFTCDVYPCRVSSRIFCLGGKIVYKDQLCEKHAKFLTSAHFGVSITNQCTKKHTVKTLGGGGVGGFRGEASPLHPPVDETLPWGIGYNYIDLDTGNHHYS